MARESKKINKLILCACDCGNTRWKYDKRGYDRKFIDGHENKGRVPYNKGTHRNKPLVVEFIYCACGCGKTRAKYNKRKQIAQFIKGHGLRVPRFGENNSKWKGGRITTKEGYAKIKNPEHPFVNKYGYFWEHRIIYEEYYKCCLLPWIHIHHKDGNRLNNTIGNLKPVTKASHRQEHKIDMSDRKCVFCGINESYDHKGKNHWFRHLNGYLCILCYQSKQWKEKYKYSQKNK